MVFQLVGAPLCSAAGQHQMSPPGIADGPGVWANVWNYPQGNLDAYCANLRSYGVRNLFIQTTRVNMPALAHADELGQLIEACHKYNIRVIGWAYLELVEPSVDAEKMLAAARYVSPHGESLDAIAPDLEKNLTAARVEKFSARLRDELGPNYPLVAVVYSPLNHYHEVNAIPWATLTHYYDVIAPMAYWKGKTQRLDAHDYTLATVRTIRQLSGRPDVEIHVIGDAMGTEASEITDFMRACREAEATSASIYPNQRPTVDQLSSLSHYSEFFVPNARFRLAAFKQMIRSGAIPADAAGDPTQVVTRTDFYKMVAHQLHTSVPMIVSAGPQTAPIYSGEALAALAGLVDAQQTKTAHTTKKNSHWFSSPAMAATLASGAPNERPLNWLDASQMVLEAGSAIK
jgi:hypothetical protein